MAQNPAIPLITRELRHDVRNQLFALRTAFAALNNSISLPDKLQRNLKLCAHSLDKLTAATNEYFALQSGEPNDEAIQLDRLISGAIEILTPALVASSLKLQVQLDPVTLNGRKVILTMGVRAVLGAAVSTARGSLKILLSKSNEVVRLSLNFPPREDISGETQAEITAAVDLAREAFALHAGAVRCEKGYLLVQVPIMKRAGGAQL